ncbi:galactose-1-phosphate uridylyltransferase [Sphaerisporangium sp. TRM90804]|uniref:galactose-1-phosphate uridylyltransferase n=1 Tax=Sphaerisporangium sp. TRM90804 TaxID=3031113 RepID=UPI0024485D89|nr:galactose-1-phosphate uridylyltransferase [Sphaerisporangium sp. TRM90804]MDH2427309.1 galactose-1-phosphate uridylyltransferase [Sphaerisporangium sp. TRM90804]
MKKTTARLADGRELIYYDSRDDAARDTVDRRPAAPATTAAEIRYDPLRDEWILIASHRQGRTHNPPTAECPLCPSREGHSEITADDYEVVVFENRFPSMAGRDGDDEAPALIADLRTPGGSWRSAPSAGRCEVVCFSPDHEASFADLSPEQVALILEAWTDRTAELSRRPDVEQVFLFEDRGKEMGMSLVHPHGQIYAYPFVTPRTERVLAAVGAYRERTGGNLFDDILAAESADGGRLVVEAEHWTAFVPHAAHWPYEVHLYPRRRVPDLTALDDDARAEFPAVYLDVLRRFDRLFGEDTGPVPYISSWSQAPLSAPGEFALHLELFTVRRTPAKLKHLAGSELLMDVFVNEISPESAAARLRELG